MLMEPGKVYAALRGSGVALTLFAQASIAAEMPAPDAEATQDWRQAFTINGEISAGIRTTSNLNSDASERSGFEALADAKINFASTWERHFLGAALLIDHVETLDQNAIDSTAEGISLTGRLDLENGWSATAEAAWVESIVDTTDPYQFSGNINGVAQSIAAATILSWSGDGRTFDFLAKFEDIETVTAVNGSQASVLDRQEFDLRAKYSWTVGEAVVYVFGGYTQIAYDDALLNRDSDGFMLGLGHTWSMGAATGLVEVAGIHQDFVGATIPTNVGFVGRIELTWPISDRTTLSFQASRQFAEQNISPVSAGLYTNCASVQLQYKLSDKVSFQGGMTYALNQFDNTDLRLDSFELDAGLVWQVQETLRIPVLVRAMRQDANDPSLASQSFDDVSLTLSIIHTF